MYHLIPAGQRIEKVNAFKVTKPRLIGDIGLRAFFQLRKRALEIIKNEKIDFVYIPIPSFYCSLIGPYLFKKTKVKYGIDYIDPWVHQFPGSDKIFSRHWLSTQFAKILEPIAVKNASLITGVADGYYNGVIERNPFLLKSCFLGSMPYGGELLDHQAVKQLKLSPYLFQKNGKIQIIYAGVILPNAISILKEIFEAISVFRSYFIDVEFHFIGTGKKVKNTLYYSVRDLAKSYNLWENIVFEYPQRIPYLDVLTHLNAADGILILGSTDIHYSPSKVYQALLSDKPLMALLHEKSPAIELLKNYDFVTLIKLTDLNDTDAFINLFSSQFIKLRDIVSKSKVSNSKLYSENTWSAKYVTGKLAKLLDQSISNTIG